MEIITLSVTDIDTTGLRDSDRLRPVDEDYARLIGANMADQGQGQPVQVLPRGADGKYKLIDGWHRVKGAEFYGLSVLAVVRDVDQLTAELMEIDANLISHDLNPLDQAVFMMRRKDLWDELYPETKAGGNRRKIQNRKFADLIPTFTQATADKLKVSRDTIERAVKRATKLSTEVQRLIRGTWIARRAVHLDAIGRLTSDEQLEVVQLLLNRGGEGHMTVADAVRQARQVPEAAGDIPERDYQKLVRLWSRADVTAKKRFKVFLSGEAGAGRRS